ncbi:MAG: TSCPD domain-containing protein, partial [Bacillota bacterium]
MGTDAKKQAAPQQVDDAPLPAREFSPRPRPDVTKGEIEKVSIGCGSLYVISAHDDVGLAEVFCETGKFGGCESQSEATGRLISYCLRLGRTPEEVEMIARDIVDQLRGIRCPACIRRPGISVTSCPDAIARSLQKQFPNLNKTPKPTPPEPRPQAALASAAPEIAATSSKAPAAATGGTPCPECGKSLVPQSGCFTCPHCGFSKCG